MDAKHFAALMAQLGDRFGRNVSASIVAAYWTAITPHLQPDQIHAGFDAIFFSDTYFPSPQRWVEAATGNLDAAALTMWDEALEADRSNRRPELDAIARDTFKSLGGWQVVAAPDRTALLRVREKFLSEYATRARQIRINALALPGGNA